MFNHISLKAMSLYIDGRLDQSGREVLAKHILECAACRGQLTSLKTTTQVLKRLPGIGVSDEFDFKVKRRLREIDEEPGIVVTTKTLASRPALAWARAAVPAAAAAALAAVLMLHQLALTPAIANVRGEVKILSHGREEWREAEEGGRVRTGDIIVVAQGGSVNIESGRYEMLLKGGARITAGVTEGLFPGKKDISYGLDKGKMLVATGKRFKGFTLKIEAPLADYIVRGTGFLVEVMPAAAGSSWVGVLDGAVEVNARYEVSGASDRVLVGMGKAAAITPEDGLSSPRYLLETEWRQVQEVYRLGEHPQVTLIISMTPRRVHELLRPAGLFISDKRSEPMPNAMMEIAGQMNKAILTGDRELHEDAISSLEEMLREYPDDKYNIQLLFFIAAYYYYIDRPDEAIGALDRIIAKYPDSNFISLAHCAKGLIYERDLNMPRPALESYKKVLANYPDSLETEEAKAGLMRLE